ncbi:hypothetical protein BJ166DRAFT_510319 [Pestalotiopsis sp. NC0098]|nr:hypothetical protein BJ166DRAFT_510319 [Pestalotiopsis sp. NC0098]
MFALFLLLARCFSPALGDRQSGFQMTIGWDYTLRASPSYSEEASRATCKIDRTHAHSAAAWNGVREELRSRSGAACNWVSCEDSNPPPKVRHIFRLSQELGFSRKTMIAVMTKKKMVFAIC